MALRILSPSSRMQGWFESRRLLTTFLAIVLFPDPDSPVIQIIMYEFPPSLHLRNYLEGLMFKNRGKILSE